MHSLGSFWPANYICRIITKYSLSKWHETFYGGTHLLDLQKKWEWYPDFMLVWKKNMLKLGKKHLWSLGSLEPSSGKKNMFYFKSAISQKSGNFYTKPCQMIHVIPVNDSCKCGSFIKWILHKKLFIKTYSNIYIFFYINYKNNTFSKNYTNVE